jgi:cyclopropane-fatty-acyl-phospholipid synthase
MYEHVGRNELDMYVRKVHELLRPGGLFLNHGITQLDSTPPDDDTLISRYVFPDGELHPVDDVLGAMQASDFEIRDAESLREHYPPTLRAWVRNLMASWHACVAEVGEARARVWQLYMLGSAQAFEAAEISVYQVLAARGGAPHGLPLRRTELLAGI